MPHPRVEAFWEIPHGRWMGTRGQGVDGHAWNWLKWCTLYFQKLVELSFAADEVSLVAFVSVFVPFFFQGINWKRICIFPWNNLILSVSPNMNKSKNLLPSLRASSPAHWRRRRKKKESLQQRLWNLNICIEKVNAKCWLAEMTLVITSLPSALFFQYLFTFALVSTSRWLAEIWQLSRREATWELEVEIKFQRRSCKLSFLFSPRRQSAPESLLEGYFLPGLSISGEFESALQF